MTDRKLIDSLREINSFNGDKERQVEAVYNNLFKDSFEEIKISNPFKCDGYFETVVNNLKTRVICEYKYDVDLKNSVSRARVICQVLFYLKKFEDNGMIFPNVVFVGDVNECFVVHTNNIVKYLDFDGVDWTVAPSCAADANIELLTTISNDETVSPFVFDIDGNFVCDSVIQKIKDLAANVVRLVRITDHNIDRVFAYFKRTMKNLNKIQANDLFYVFYERIVLLRNIQNAPLVEMDMGDLVKSLQKDLVLQNEIPDVLVWGHREISHYDNGREGLDALRILYMRLEYIHRLRSQDVPEVFEDELVLIFLLFFHVSSRAEVYYITICDDGRQSNRKCTRLQIREHNQVSSRSAYSIQL